MYVKAHTVLSCENLIANINYSYIWRNKNSWFN